MASNERQIEFRLEPAEGNPGTSPQKTIRLKITPPEGIEVSPREVEISSGRGSAPPVSVTVRTTGMPSQGSYGTFQNGPIWPIRLEAEGESSGGGRFSCPILLVVGNTTRPGDKREFQAGPTSWGAKKRNNR